MYQKNILFYLLLACMRIEFRNKIINSFFEFTIQPYFIMKFIHKIVEWYIFTEKVIYLKVAKKLKIFGLL